MGIASYDITGDGLPEVFLDEPRRQQAPDARRRSRPTATTAHIALQAGVTAPRPYAGGDVLPSTAWHAEFQDVNNDGFVDLFVTKGNVEAHAGLRHEGPEQPDVG